MRSKPTHFLEIITPFTVYYLMKIDNAFRLIRILNSGQAAIPFE